MQLARALLGFFALIRVQAHSFIFEGIAQSTVIAQCKLLAPLESLQLHKTTFACWLHYNVLVLAFHGFSLLSFIVHVDDLTV